VALSSGRWLWSALVGGFGREPDFSGWFDAIIVFFFDVPNLAIAELVIRVSRRNWSVLVDSGASVLLLACLSAFIALRPRCSRPACGGRGLSAPQCER
jgi:phosphoglycerol transferase MdoB-like AlkP superfamily enzyme